MKKITLQGIREYFKEENLTPRHDIKRMKYAFNRLAKEEDVDAWDLFYLLIENRSMTGTHTYSFHTAYGRHLIDTFAHYYEYESWK